jgi:hypothetical protein
MTLSSDIFLLAELASTAESDRDAIPSARDRRFHEPSGPTVWFGFATRRQLDG